MYKHEKNFTPTNPYFLDKSYGYKYNKHNTDEVVEDTPYWDTKENDEYWSLPRWKRIQLYLKDKVNFKFGKEFLYLNAMLIFVLIYYSYKKSKQIII